MTDNEKRIMELLPTLKQYDKDYLQDIAADMVWRDWDANCNFTDELRISEAVDDYQVIRRWDVEGMQHWEVINVNKPEEWPEWVDKIDLDYYEQWEDDGEIYQDVLFNEAEVLGEMAQWWLNTRTGEIVLLGRPYAGDNNYFDEEEPMRICEEGSVFYKRFFEGCIGMQTRHFDMSVHENLLKVGYEPITLCDGEDLNYVEDGIGKGYYEMDGDIHLHMQRMLRDAWYAPFIRYYGMGVVAYLDNADYMLAFRIAMRHKYTIHNHMRYIRHLNELIYLGKDLHNPHFVCPTAELIQQIKVQAENRRERIRAAQERERRRKEAYENEHADEIFYELRKDFLGITFSNGQFVAHVLQSRAEYFEEGEAMHHCVGKMGYWKKLSSICIGIRDMAGNRQATAEISLDKFSIIQCYAVGNRVHEFDDEIRDMIMDNMYMFRLAADGKAVVIRQAV